MAIKTIPWSKWYEVNASSWEVRWSTWIILKPNYNKAWKYPQVCISYSAEACDALWMFVPENIYFDTFDRTEYIHLLVAKLFPWKIENRRSKKWFEVPKLTVKNWDWKNVSANNLKWHDFKNYPYRERNYNHVKRTDLEEIQDLLLEWGLVYGGQTRSDIATKVYWEDSSALRQRVTRQAAELVGEWKLPHHNEQFTVMTDIIKKSLKTDLLLRKEYQNRLALKYNLTEAQVSRFKRNHV